MDIKLKGLHAALPPTGSPMLGLRFVQQQVAPPVSATARRRIWEISNSFHCSIIGTCLTTTELRQILVKIGLPGVQKETDHQLHGRAVLLAGQQSGGTKLLQKALDRRHRGTIAQFAKARTDRELRAQWDAAMARADIPGAYWALLTHAETTEDLMRHVFGEVHMLSHLVGAANRADIRRLREQDAEIAALEEKVARQQEHLRKAITSRDAAIVARDDALARAASAASDHAGPVSETDLAAKEVIADLESRLAIELAARARIDRRLQSACSELEDERHQRTALEETASALRRELEVAEQALADILDPPSACPAPTRDLGGITVLYVGGRAHQVSQLRRLAEQCNASLLHHDGGVDDRSGLLEAQVARADWTLFPVDSVSHNAVTVVKRISRSLGKPFVPLRSSGLTSFAATLRSLAVTPREV